MEPDQPLPAPLTPRELEVIRLVAGGFTGAAVARRLGIQPGTVTAHLHSIYRKLGVTSRRDAIEVAARLGLLTSA